MVIDALGIVVSDKKSYIYNFRIIFYVKHVTPRVEHFWPQGPYLKENR